MSKIKAIISDFDNTLVDHNQSYSQKTKELIGRITAKGIKFSLATGRSHYGVLSKVIKELDIDGLHICHGGATIYDSVKDAPILAQPISRTSVRYLVDTFMEKNLAFAIEGAEFSYKHPFTVFTKYLEKELMKRIEEYDGKTEIYKAVLFATANDLNEKVLDDLIKNIEDQLKDVSIIKFNFSGKFGVDITSEKSTKHTAILEYRKILGLKQEEIVGIGDSYNDYPLLTASGFKIAMGDSPESLKEIADLVVPSTGEGGMEKALEHVLEFLI